MRDRSGIGGDMDALVFEIDRRSYALPLASVAEVVRAVAITELPGAPGIVEGVIDVRGQLVPVLDMRRRFGHPARPLDPDQHMILAKVGDRLVAFRVDRAADVRPLEPSPLEEVTAAGGDYVAGIGRTEDGLLLIHDPERFLAESERASLEAALEERGRP